MANVDAPEADAEILILLPSPPVVQVVPALPAVPASAALRALAWLIDLLLVAALVWLTQQTLGKTLLGLTLVGWARSRGCGGPSDGGASAISSMTCPN